MSEGPTEETDRDIFDFITADTDEGREFAQALREDTAVVEIGGQTFTPDELEGDEDAG
jgi:hypothetical protein